MADDKLLALPGSSWETVKKIVRAFYANQGQENAKVEDIAKLAGVPRPVVSMNNNFLKSVGIIRPDGWKLTEQGLRYAMGVARNNDSMAAESLATLVRQNPILNQLLSLLRARGTMKQDTFKAEIVILLDLTENRQSAFIKPLLDMLGESGLVHVADDGISLNETEVHPPPGGDRPAPKQQTILLQEQELQMKANNRLPLPLGPGRLAYIELPTDWEARELPKLLKILELALGDSF